MLGSLSSHYLVQAAEDLHKDLIRVPFSQSLRLVGTIVLGRPLYGRRDSPATASGLAFSGHLFAVARQMGRSWGDADARVLDVRSVPLLLLTSVEGAQPGRSRPMARSDLAAWRRCRICGLLRVGGGKRPAGRTRLHQITQTPCYLGFWGPR